MRIIHNIAGFLVMVAMVAASHVEAATLEGSMGGSRKHINGGQELPAIRWYITLTGFFLLRIIPLSLPRRPSKKSWTSIRRCRF